MDTDVVDGICDLLQQKDHLDIVRFTIKACTYISMNYDFINAPTYSVPIIKEFIRLIDELKQRNDQYNIIYAIKNILKGAKENK